jgi:hypothetical protein
VKYHGLYLLDRIYPSEMVFEFHGAGRIYWIFFFLNSLMELRNTISQRLINQPVGAVVHCDTYSGRFSSFGAVRTLCPSEMLRLTSSPNETEETDGFHGVKALRASSKNIQNSKFNHRRRSCRTCITILSQKHWYR